MHNEDLNKQIEEMAKVIHTADVDYVKQRVKCIEQGVDLPYYTRAQYQANSLISIGYRKSTEVAEEIFAEIEKETEIGRIMNACAIVSLDALAELKKKYIGEDTNVTTNTEGEK